MENKSNMRGYDTKYTLAVAAAFIEYRGRFLLVFDPKFGFWRVPGGRMERIEAPEDTLRREIKEELGISIRVGKFIGFGRDNVWVKTEKRLRSRCILYFQAKAKSDHLKPLKSEVSKFQWLTMEEIKKIKPLEPAMIDLFARFKAEEGVLGIEV